MDTIKEAHYNLGIAYLEAGQYDRAVPEFEAAIKLDANFIGAHCALCRAYLEQNELERASTSVTAALKLDATHQPALLLRDTLTQAYYNKGKDHLNAERYTEAVSTFQKALTLNADLGQSSQVSDIESKHIYAHLGAAYIGLKSYREAIDALQNAIALDADLVDAHYNLGYAYVEQGSYDKAIPHLERAITIAPNFKRAHYNLARVYRESGNLEAATHALTETLRLDPNYQRAHELANSIKQAHYNKGITYLNDERYSEAITAFQNAITLDADFTTAHYNLGLTYLKMETYVRAVDALQKTITLDRNYKAAHHSLALAYLGQQKLGKARDAARETLKLDPNYQPALSLLEAIDPTFTPSETQPVIPTVDDVEKAASNTDTNSESTHHPLGNIRQAQSIQPTQPTGTSENASDAKKHYERGEAFLNTKQHNEASAAFKRAIKADPNFADAHYGLGVAYLEMGALDDAKTAAEEAFRLKADRQRVHELLTAIKHIETSQHRRKFWKKGLSYVAVLGIIAAVIIVIVNWPLWPNPPKLSIDTSLSRNHLMAGKTVTLTLTIKNSGGTVPNVKIQLQPQSRVGLNYETPAPIPEMLESGEETIEIPITADRNIGNREESLKIELIGNNGTSLATAYCTLRILDTVR